MTRKMFSINDIISLGVMLLMMVALIAAQANATDYQAAVSEMAETGGYGYENAVLPLNARINARFDAAAITISIDVSAELRQLLLDDK
jgi:hypothetical protein